MREPTYVSLIDADTGDEIEEGRGDCEVIPRAGERILWWQDGFPEAAGSYTGLRKDFEVVCVEHDWRFMPAGVRPKTVRMVVLHVRAMKGDAP